MLHGQGLKVAAISFVALLFGIATAYFQPKVNHDGPLIAGVCALFQLMLTMWGCVIVARARGLNSKWCLVGLIGLFGIAILLLFLLENQKKSPMRIVMGTRNRQAQFLEANIGFRA